MDFLENLKQEINQILGIERQEDESAQFGRENNGRKISPTEICGSRNVGLKNVIKIASDKKFKNCGADLSVNLKDLGVRSNAIYNLECTATKVFRPTTCLAMCGQCQWLHLVARNTQKTVVQSSRCN